MLTKILHVIDHLAAGGGQLAIPQNFTEYMDRDKFQSFICTLRPDATPAEIPETKVVILDYAKWDPRPLFALPKICAKYDIDIIHAHLEKSVMLCILAGYLCKTPLIVNEHGGIFKKGITLYGLFMKIFHRKPAVVVAASQATTAELMRKTSISKEKIEIIHSAIDLDIFDTSKVSQNQARKNLGITDEETVIGYVGRLHKVRAVDLIIKALPLLLKKSSDYILLLSGTGPERKSLEALTQKLGITKHVKFLGFYHNLPELMSTFDLGVIPSLHEAFPRVAIEMMRMKVPVVSSGSTGLAELVKDGKTGIVTRQNNPEAIRDAIERLMADDQLRKHIIQQAYEFSGQFGIKEHVRKLEELYTRIMSAKRS